MNHQKRKTSSAHNKPRPGETSIRPETTNSFNDHTSITSWMKLYFYLRCRMQVKLSFKLPHCVTKICTVYNKSAHFVFECKSWSLSLVSGNQGCTNIPQTESLGIILGMLPWKNTRVDSSFIFGWMKQSVMKDNRVRKCCYCKYVWSMSWEVCECKDGSSSTMQVRLGVIVLSYTYKADSF